MEVKGRCSCSFPIEISLKDHGLNKEGTRGQVEIEVNNIFYGVL